MREYGKIFSTIWESPDFRALSEDGRTLVLYLLSCKHNTIAGVFRLPDGYACEDLQWTAARVSKGFAELAERFADRCETTKWVWIRKFLEWNAPENPNQRKAAAKVVASIPDQCAWKRAFMRVCGPALGIEAPATEEELSNGSETLSKPGTGTGTGTGEISKTTSSHPRKRGEPQGLRFEEFWLSWPKHERKQDRAKCWDHWRRNDLDALTDTILADVRTKRGTTKWRDGFIEAPLVYLRGRRWEDGVEPASAVVETLAGDL